MSEWPLNEYGGGVVKESQNSLEISDGGNLDNNIPAGYMTVQEAINRIKSSLMTFGEWENDYSFLSDNGLLDLDSREQMIIVDAAKLERWIENHSFSPLDLY